MSSVSNLAATVLPTSGYQIAQTSTAGTSSTQAATTSGGSASSAQSGGSSEAGGGGAGGGASAASGSSSSTTIVTETSLTNPDGSVTTTITYADGTTSTSTSEPDPTKANYQFKQQQKLSGATTDSSTDAPGAANTNAPLAVGSTTDILV